jgi:periplasmic protein TonB
MSYKALLFCPDPRVVRAVTQVLTELEFMTEVSADVFQTSKKLSDERCDALVVDCQNEQDAAILFKAARNSTANHGALMVAVVEGQAGVAAAFRIGANLVLTKPINVEQSKGTLRVAKGLLRKNEARSASQAIASPGISSAPPSSGRETSTAVPTPLFIAPAASASASAVSPFSALEVENEPTPAPEPAEAAVLESLHDPGGKPSPAASAETELLKSSAEPIAASPVTSSGGAAAAAVMAPIKPAVELKTAAPLASHEAIVSGENSFEPFEVAGAPTFSSYAQATEGQGSSKIFRNVVVLILLCAGGFALWQKFQPMHYLHKSDASDQVSEAAPVADSSSSEVPPASPVVSSSSNSTAAPEAATPPAPKLRTIPDHYVAPETIDVGDTSAAPESKVTVTTKPQPIVVKTRSADSRRKNESAVTSAPPTFSIAASDPDAALSKLVTTNGVLPKPAPSSVRVSQGVSQGLIVKRVAPVYPSVALQLRKQGSVDLLATVNKDGAITAVKVLSGDNTLAKSAVDAVRQWKYRPYLLNGEPVEIQTQITINFRLPN